MKIRIITCHDVYNYGASLQALALQTYLERQGNDVRIIDYRPGKRYDIWAISPKSRLYKVSKYFFPIKLCLAIKKYFQFRPTFGRIDAFKSFNKKYLKLSKHYNNFSELAIDPPEADMYIAGSDQIWSTYLNNGSDPAFYCCFGNLATKRISYAASFGFPQIFKGLDVLVANYIKGLDAVSVREKTGFNLLREMGIESTRVLDPVFLLNNLEWISLLDIKESAIKTKYILVYDIFHSDERLKNRCLCLAKKYNLKIVAVNDKTLTKYADININNAGPREFVELISNAEYVVADSFHATVFSILFEKQFYIYYKKDNISRISDILSDLGMEERLNSEKELPTINWQKHVFVLEKEINVSKDFLLHQLKND